MPCLARPARDMMAKAEEILPPSAVVAGGTSEERPLQEAENREGARWAKQPRTLPTNLNALSSPAKEGEESGGLGLRGISFSFDMKSVVLIGTTPKFGSFHSSALDLVGSGESALIEEKEVEEDEKGEVKRRRTASPVLDTRASPMMAEEDEESGGSVRVGFLFSFDVRTAGAVEATPKFESFLCAATDLGMGAAEAGDGAAKDMGAASRVRARLAHMPCRAWHGWAMPAQAQARPDTFILLLLLLLLPWPIFFSSFLSFFPFFFLFFLSFFHSFWPILSLSPFIFSSDLGAKA